MVMNDDVINDLKQFIEATVSQQLAQQTERLETKINGVAQKVDDIAAGIAEAPDTSNEVVDEQLADHEQRITRLEQKPA